jgi:hypothetical protein
MKRIHRAGLRGQALRDTISTQQEAERASSEATNKLFAMSDNQLTSELQQLSVHSVRTTSSGQLKSLPGNHPSQDPMGALVADVSAGRVLGGILMSISLGKRGRSLPTPWSLLSLSKRRLSGRHLWLDHQVPQSYESNSGGVESSKVDRKCASQRSASICSNWRVVTSRGCVVGATGSAMPTPWAPLTRVAWYCLVTSQVLVEVSPWQTAADHCSGGHSKDMERICREAGIQMSEGT